MSIKGNNLSILKTKEAEINALHKLDGKIKKNMDVLMELTPVPVKYVNKNKILVCSVQSHLRGIAEGLSQALARPLFDQSMKTIFLDGRYVDARVYDEKGLWPTIFCGEQLRQRWIEVIPVIGFEQIPEFYDAISNFIRKNDQCLCIRIPWKQFQILDYCSKQLNSIFKQFNIGKDRIHLIVDFEDLSDYSKMPDRLSRAEFLKKVRVYLKIFPDIEKFRSIYIAGSSIPKSFSKMKENTEREIERVEWWLWRELVNSNDDVAARLKFGDYGTEWCGLRIGGGNIPCPVYGRYLIGQNFKIYKKGDIRFGVKQFSEICKEIIKLKSFDSSYSQGDRFIFEIAKLIRKPEGPVFWKEIGLSHHMTSVALEVLKHLSSLGKKQRGALATMVYKKSSTASN